MIFVNPFFVNPFTIWANLALKSGEAMLEAAEAAIARPEVAQPAAPPMVEFHEADAPPPKAKARPKAKVHSKAKGKKRRTRR